MAGTILPIDAIDEFSLQTNNNAEQGRNSGGTLNLVIKSGTNDFNGSLYYFNRNEFLAARNWFTPTSSPIQELRNNQEGGSLGGPTGVTTPSSFLLTSSRTMLPAIPHRAPRPATPG